MPPLDRDELARFLGEHLTAAAVMVPIADPIDPGQLIRLARDYMADHKFDLALVGGDRLLVLARDTADRAATATPSRLVGEVAESPRRDRVIERTLPLRQVTCKLRDDPHPLLVVGGDAISHIVTVADFAGVAGTAAVLVALLTLDVKLNTLLLTQEDAALKALDSRERDRAKTRRRRAAKKGEELPSLLDYLSMTPRLQLVRDLGLAEQFGLGTEEEHQVLINTRNAAAHRGLHDPRQALGVLDLAEQLLDRVDDALQ